MSNRPIAAASLCAVALASAMTILPVAASAHAFLQNSAPAVGSTIRTAPAEVRIDFTEGIEPAFTTIQATNAQGQRVDRGGGHIEGDDTHFAVALKTLPPGLYHVTWKAVATDTHHTEGSFTFTVAP